jgi:hypothetical protein
VQIAAERMPLRKYDLEDLLSECNSLMETSRQIKAGLQKHRKDRKVEEEEKAGLGPMQEILVQLVHGAEAVRICSALAQETA